jgi:hypothetical protein
MSDTYTDMRDFIYNVDNYDEFNQIYNTVLNGMSYSPTKNVSFLGNMETRFTEIRNYFLGASTIENRKRNYYDSVAKLAIDTKDEINNDADILLINSLLDQNNNESLVKLDLQSKLRIAENPTINMVPAHTTFNVAQGSDILKQYITYEQTKNTDKATLRGGDRIFNMLSHANRSIYVKGF